MKKNEVKSLLGLDIEIKVGNTINHKDVESEKEEVTEYSIIQRQANQKLKDKQ